MSVAHLQVCAYANNQHHLEADVGEHPRRSLKGVAISCAVTE